MKKLFSILAVLSLSSALATAGDYGKNPVEKNPVVIPAGCDCFGTGFEFSGFVSGLMPESGDNNVGGGASLSYFFTENVGFETSYNASGSSNTDHVITGNIAYRMPITDLCIAPYILAGGGVKTNGSTKGLWDLGGGIDIRLESMGCVGLFGDATYNWVSGGENFTLVRAGVRIAF